MAIATFEHKGIDNVTTPVTTTFDNVSGSYASLSGSYTQVSSSFSSLSGSDTMLSSAFNSSSGSFATSINQLVSASSSFAANEGNFSNFSASFSGSVKVSGDVILSSSTTSQVTVSGSLKVLTNETVVGNLQFAGAPQAHIATTLGQSLVLSGSNSLVSVSGALALRGFTSASLPNTLPTGSVAYVADKGFLAVFVGGNINWMRIASASF